MRTPTRFCVCLLFLAALGAGCNAGIVTSPALVFDDGGGQGVGPDLGGGGEGVDPETLFASAVAPLLDNRCAVCHADASRGPGFMEGGDVYAAIKGWPGLVAPGNPGASSLLSKGSHAGPAWNGTEQETITAWIQAEGGGGGAVPVPAARTGDIVVTSPQPITEGQNTVDLSEIGIAGAELRFSAQRVALGVRLADLIFYTDATGARIDGPEFRVYGDSAGGAMISADDRFDSTQLVILPDSSATLAASLILDGFPDSGYLSVAFQAATSFGLGDDPGAGVGDAPPRVTRLSLYDTDTDTPIAGYAPLDNGTVIDLSGLGTENVAIRAETYPPVVGSVVFDLDGDREFDIENNAPYVMGGDERGDYVPRPPPYGEHTITATAYSEANRGGAAGPPLTIQVLVR